MPQVFHYPDSAQPFSWTQLTGWHRTLVATVSTDGVIEGLFQEKPDHVQAQRA